MSIEFIIDDFTAARGEPALLELRCARCGRYLMSYQKDGPGPLIRCYWDRIHEPLLWKDLQRLPEESQPDRIACPGCGDCIGHKTVYEKENRLAFHLVEGCVAIKALENSPRSPSPSPEH